MVYVLLFIVGGTFNVVLTGKPSAQSTTYSNRGSHLAVDGDPSTSIHTAASDPIVNQGYSDVWWSVDLGQIFTVTSVTLTNLDFSAAGNLTIFIN